MGGVAIARRPVTSLECDTNTTQQWRTWRRWYTCCSVCGFLSDSRSSLTIAEIIKSHGRCCRVLAKESFSRLIHWRHSSANQWPAVCRCHFFRLDSARLEPRTSRCYIVMENPRNRVELRRLVEKGLLLPLGTPQNTQRGSPNHCRGEVHLAVIWLN